MYILKFELPKRKTKVLQFEAREKESQLLQFEAEKKEPVRLDLTRNFKLDFKK